jgi:CO dehydrogenase nickel-insertion accessory protein CooC1
MGIRNIWTVLNKATSDDIAVKVGTALKRHGIQVIGRLHFDTGLFEASVEGKVPAEGKVAEDIREVLDVILIDGAKTIE